MMSGNKLLIRMVFAVSLVLLPLLHALAAGNRALPQAQPPSPAANSRNNQDPLAPLLAQAQDALDRKDYTAAIALLQQIVAARPADALPHFELGYAYSELKRNDEAAAELRRAIALNDALAPAH